MKNFLIILLIFLLIISNFNLIDKVMCMTMNWSNNEICYSSECVISNSPLSAMLIV